MALRGSTLRSLRALRGAVPVLLLFGGILMLPPAALFLLQELKTYDGYSDPAFVLVTPPADRNGRPSSPLLTLRLVPDCDPQADCSRYTWIVLDPPAKRGTLWEHEGERPLSRAEIKRRMPGRTLYEAGAYTVEITDGAWESRRLRLSYEDEASGRQWKGEFPLSECVAESGRNGERSSTVSP